MSIFILLNDLLETLAFENDALCTKGEKRLETSGTAITHGWKSFFSRNAHRTFCSAYIDFRRFFMPLETRRNVTFFGCRTHIDQQLQFPIFVVYFPIFGKKISLSSCSFLSRHSVIERYFSKIEKQT